jgi:hypothetical protein
MNQSKGETLQFDPHTISITIDPFKRITLSLLNVKYTNVTLKRAFPLSMPESCIVVYDQTNTELGIITSLEELDSYSKEVVRNELSHRYFTISVLAINKVLSRYGVSTWYLQTDKGSRTIYVKDRSDIRKITDEKVVITDNEGMRFCIENVKHLDQKSYELLEAQL